MAANIDFPDLGNPEVEFPSGVSVSQPPSEEARSQVTTAAGVAYGNKVADQVNRELTTHSDSPTLKVNQKLGEDDMKKVNNEAARTILLSQELSEQERISQAKFLLENEQKTSAGQVEKDATTVALYGEPVQRDTNQMLHEKLKLAHVDYKNSFDQVGSIVREVLANEMPGWMEVLAGQEEVSGGDVAFGTLEALTPLQLLTEGGRDRAGQRIDFVETLIPFSSQEVLLDAMEQVFPEAYENLSLVDTFAAGETVNTFQNLLMQLPPEEMEAAVRKTIEVVKDNAGYLNGNEFIAWMALSDLFEQYTQTGTESADLARIANNVGSALDITGVGGTVVKTLPKLTKMTTKLGLGGRMLENAPNTVGKSFADVVGNAEAAVVTNRKLGTTQDDIVKTTIPAAEDSVVPALPDSVRENMKAQRVEIEKAKAFVLDGNENPMDVRMLEQQQDIVNAMEAIEGYHVNKSIIKATDEGITVRAVYGNDSSYGFATKEDAVAKMEERFPDEPIELVAKDENGTVVRVDPESDVDYPEYFAVIRENYKANEIISGIDEIVLGGFNKWGNETPSVIHRLTRATNAKGHALSEFLLPEQRFSKETVGAVTKALDLFRGSNKELQRLATQNFVKLKQDDQYAVGKLLQQGNVEEKVFTPEELTQLLPGNERAVKAYYDMRQVYDGLWELLSETMDTKLSRNGFLMYDIDDTTYIGRPLLVDDLPNGGTAYNPITKAIEPIDGDVALARTHTKLVIGDDSTDYLKIPAEGVRSRTVRNSVPYREGYVPNVYKDNYFVRVKRKGTHNGKPDTIEQAIATAPTLKAAQRLANEMKALPKYRGAEVFADRSKQLKGELEDNIEDIATLMGTANGPTGKRGAKLKGAGSLDNLHNPLDAMASSITAVTKKAALEPVTDDMQKSILDTYGRFLKVDEKTGQPMLPRSPSDFNPASGVSNKIMEEAIEQQKYLDSINKMQDNFVANTYKAGIIRLAESVSNEKLSEILISGYSKDPVKLLTSPAFIVQLGLNITRQWLVQGAQIIFLAGSFNPFKLASDSAGAMIGRMATYTKSKPALKAASKFLGLTPQQTQQYVDAMKLSGILAVDSLSHSQDALRQMGRMWIDPEVGNIERAGRRTLDLAARAATAIPRFATKVGFEAAEDMSIMMHWTVAFRNWQKANPGKFPSGGKQWQEVAEETRRLSLNFTRTGEAAYQKGMLRPMFQYMSFQHKAYAASMPSFFGGSTQFSSKEKSMRAMSQFLMFGAGGVVGGQWVYDRVSEKLGKPIPPIAREVMDGLIMDTAFNYVASEVTGEEQNLDLAQDIAPLGGIEGAGASLVHNIWDNPSLVALMGPSASAYSKMYQAVADAYAVTQLPNLDTKEKITEALDSVLRIAPQYDNQIKLMMYKNAGAIVNKHFESIDAATVMESFAVALFGLQTKEMTTYYQIQKDLHGRYNPPNQSKEVQKITEDLYRRLNKQATDILGAPAESVTALRNNYIDEWQRNINGMLALLDPNMRVAVQDQLFRKFQRDEEDATTKVIAWTADQVDRGMDTNAVHQAIVMARQQGELDPVNEQIIYELYDELLRREEGEQ